LPTGQTLAPYNAVSVWCAQFGVNFGSGTFGFAGDLDDDGFVGITDLNIILGHWNQNVTPDDDSQGDPSGDGFVGIEDLNTVLGNWNAGVPPAGPVGKVPEPTTCATLLLGACTYLGVRRHER
jgi:hypothetical protein